MRKIIFLAFLSITAMTSCAPEGNETIVSRRDDTVNEQAVNNLAANKWCQLNPTSGETEYIWSFDKNLQVTSTQTTTQAQEFFTWSIDVSNLLTVFLAPNAPLFRKFVTYNYNVTSHKRTMRWNESQVDPIDFVECE